jgi:hypothetical protein
VEQVRQRLALARNWAWHAEIARMEGMDDANTDTMVSTTPENVQALFNRLTEEAR